MGLRSRWGGMSPVSSALSELSVLHSCCNTSAQLHEYAWNSGRKSPSIFILDSSWISAVSCTLHLPYLYKNFSFVTTTKWSLALSRIVPLASRFKPKLFSLILQHGISYSGSDKLTALSTEMLCDKYRQLSLAHKTGTALLSISNIQVTHTTENACLVFLVTTGNLNEFWALFALLTRFCILITSP